MANSPDLVAHCVELLSALGPVRVARMFGGHGLYVDGRFLALIAADTLYLKTDDAQRARFVDAGCRPFTFQAASGKRSVLGYWSAPHDAMETPAAMLPWARLALAAALRSAARPPPGQRPAAPQHKRPAARA